MRPQKKNTITPSVLNTGFSCFPTIRWPDQAHQKRRRRLNNHGISWWDLPPRSWIWMILNPLGRTAVTCLTVLPAQDTCVDLALFDQNLRGQESLVVQIEIVLNLLYDQYSLTFIDILLDYISINMQSCDEYDFNGQLQVLTSEGKTIYISKNVRPMRPLRPLPRQSPSMTGRVVQFLYVFLYILFKRSLFWWNKTIFGTIFYVFKYETKNGFLWEKSNGLLCRFDCLDLNNGMKWGVDGKIVCIQFGSPGLGFALDP